MDYCDRIACAGLRLTLIHLLQGFVYLQFQSGEGAAAAQKALHGRWFAGRQIVAEFQFAPIYSQYFKVV